MLFSNWKSSQRQSKQFRLLSMILLKNYEVYRDSKMIILKWNSWKSLDET